MSSARQVRRPGRLVSVCLGRGTGLPCQEPRWLRISQRRSPASRTS